MKKDLNFDVHKSLKARKAWGIKMKLLFIGFILIVAGASVMLYFGFNHKWDPETEKQPVITPVFWWQWLLLILGAVIAVGSTVGFLFLCFHKFNLFYKSREKYWNTQEFANQKAEALKVNLLTLKKAQLKWYKRMGYIDGNQMRQTFEQQKQLKEKNKKHK